MCISRRDRAPQGPSPDGPGMYVCPMRVPARLETGPPGVPNHLIALIFIAHHSPPLTYPLTYGIIGRH
jgi:hypothetical protein